MENGPCLEPKGIWSSHTWVVGPETELLLIREFARQYYSRFAPDLTKPYGIRLVGNPYMQEGVILGLGADSKILGTIQLTRSIPCPMEFSSSSS